MSALVTTPLYGGSFQVEDRPVLPFVLPGERVAVDGHLVQVSVQRVTPGCVHFGRCGGCHYQHADQASQLAWKSIILNDLARDAKLTLPALHVESGEPWHYRSRIRLRVRTIDGILRVGYNLRGSNEFLAIAMCPISAPLLWRAAEALVAMAASSPASARWLAAVDAVELFCNHDESKLQAQFLLAEAGPEQRAKDSFAGLCGGLQKAVPELAGAGALLDPELGRRQRRSWDGAAWAAAGLLYTVAGKAFWVSRGAFFQVNRTLLDRFAALVTAPATAPGEGGLAWDLFAGVGLFSRLLAAQFKQVIAVEGGAVAAADLLAQSRADGFTARSMATLDFLREQEFQRERPSLVVLDPPRAGLGPEGAGLLARIGPAAIRYVSCDPVTLVRDLAILVRGGYRIDKAHLIDLFPQTYHLETVIFLTRA